MRFLIIGILPALVLAVLQIQTASAHWDMEARFWGDSSGERFYLRLHNGSHANRSPVQKELNVCFWLEEQTAAKTYVAITEKKCNRAVMKPDEWMDFMFDRREGAVQGQANDGGKLKKGAYRAVAVAREQKSRLNKIIFGAALEKQYSYFEVK